MLHSITGLEDMMKAIDTSTNSVFLRTEEGSTDLAKIKAAHGRGEVI